MGAASGRESRHRYRHRDATDAQRLALADIVIDSGGTREETLARARALYSVLQKCWPDRLNEAPGLYTTLQP